MEATNLTAEQAENLQQQISSLKTQDGDFIKWYLISLIHNRRKITSGFRKAVYLPYTGNDPEVIMRLFHGYIRLQFPKLCIDESNNKVIEFLINVASGTEEKKGLIIRGECGVGKTALLRVWLKFRLTVLASPFLKQPIESMEFSERMPKIVFFDPMSLLSNFTKEGYEFFSGNFGEIFVLDDLGITTSINYFGTPVNILEQIILSRYSKFKQNPNLELYGTTNLTTDQLNELIGQRAMSRLSEMSAWKEGLMIGSDRRKDRDRLVEWPTFPQYDPIKII